MGKTKLRRIEDESDIDNLVEGDIVRAVIICNNDDDIYLGRNREGYPVFYEGKINGQYTFMKFESVFRFPLILSYRQHREKIFLGEDSAGKESIIVTTPNTNIRIYNPEREREEYDKRKAILEGCGLINK